MTSAANIAARAASRLLGLSKKPRRVSSCAQLSPRDGRRFFFFGKFEVIPRNLSMMVANRTDQRTVSELQILFCTGAILLRSEGGAPKFLAFSPIRAGEYASAGTPLKFSGLSPDTYSVHEDAGLISKARGFRQPIESTSI